ncbi:hypothetical protein PMAYCL1PPCAC_13596 [Pristionchus mayeri]|uniref:Dehydrogenase n=1 Tax=Pristionchus mayeri TaxID=1317129 RepID=A0AAN5CHB6_9BILA|nr:hypothetical protein PMAYCL1PPCAC_13596 [Pristionchus mayeri]
MSFFNGKVVIITGSSNGIGRGTAVLFAKQGAKVTITGRNAASLEETKRLCLQAGAKHEDILEVAFFTIFYIYTCFQLIGDLTNESFNEQLISATVAKFGKLDVLVNNAGGASFEHWNKKIMEQPVSEFDKMMEINVKPVLRLSQLAIPHLEKTKGAIVNVSSIGAYLKLNPIPYYGAAKSALDQITVQMAGSLIKKGIRVNSVNPGPVLTNFAVAAGAPQEVSDKLFEEMASNPSIPLGRVALPVDIGKLILFLADRTQSEILIGNIMTADGGCNLISAMFPDK